MGSRSFRWKKQRIHPRENLCKNTEKSVSAAVNRAKHGPTPSMFARARTHVYVHEHMEKLDTTGGARGSRVLRVITGPG